MPSLVPALGGTGLGACQARLLLTSTRTHRSHGLRRCQGRHAGCCRLVREGGQGRGAACARAGLCGRHHLQVDRTRGSTLPPLPPHSPQLNSRPPAAPRAPADQVPRLVPAPRLLRRVALPARHALARRADGPARPRHGPGRRRVGHCPRCVGRGPRVECPRVGVPRGDGKAARLGLWLQGRCVSSLFSCLLFSPRGDCARIGADGGSGGLRPAVNVRADSLSRPATYADSEPRDD